MSQLGVFWLMLTVGLIGMVCGFALGFIEGVRIATAVYR